LPVIKTKTTSCQFDHKVWHKKWNWFAFGGSWLQLML